MWVIGGFKLNYQNSNNSVGKLIDVDSVYPIGSVYLSVNQVEPVILFGGKWEQINNKIILDTNDEYENSAIYMWKRIE